MKIKVRGLVFFGFAAAVFAQSAFATDSEEVIATKKKTVTSQYYVEDKFNTAFGGTEGQVILQGATAGTTSYQTAGNTSDYINTSDTGTYAGDGKLVTGKAVAQAIAAAQTVATNIIGDDDYIDTENVMDGSTVIGKKVKVISSSVTDGTAASITDSNTTASGESVAAKDKLATAGAVYNYAQDKSKFVAATSTTTGEGQNAVTTWASGITGNADQNDKYPSSKAVYEFVTGAISTAGNSYQPKVVDNTHAKLYIGKDDSSNGATWKELEAVDDTNSQASSDYVSIATGTGGVYQINLLDSKIGHYGTTTTGANAHNSDITASSDKLATGQAVYEFVSDGYQPKTTATSVQTGYNGTWHTLGGDSYITVADDGTASSVTLGNFAASTDLYGSSNTNDAKLVRAGEVRSVLSQATETTGANNSTVYATTITGNGQNDVFPSAQNVFEFVMAQTNGLTIPAIPTACSEAITASSGKTCALVMAWDSNNSAIGLEWTVMAQ